MAASPASGRVLPLVLAGGSGTRLWPLSRELYPKQFLRLVGEGTMLQHTLSRLEGMDHDDPVIVCNHEHRFIVAEQCREQGVEPGAIILEPAPRNTAPAVALGAMRCLRDDADPLLLVLPADHHIADDDAFREAVARAATLAADGALVTFGITPSRPETGYGYILAGKELAGKELAGEELAGEELAGEERSAAGRAAAVAKFTEKPNRETAEKLIAQGGCYWNSGMFLFRASAYLEELATFRPDIHEACSAAVAGERRDLDFHRPGAAFNECPAESVDRAVMERTKRGIVVRADMGLVRHRHLGCACRCLRSRRVGKHRSREM